MTRLARTKEADPRELAGNVVQRLRAGFIMMKQQM